MNGTLDNGVLKGTIPAVQNASTYNVNIGRRSDGILHFAGKIDNLRIYPRALLQSEVQTDMNSPIVP